MNAQTTTEQGSEWTDDEIVDVLKNRAHHLKLSNGWRVITLIAASELVRQVRDDLQKQLNHRTRQAAEYIEKSIKLEAELAAVVAENHRLAQRIAQLEGEPNERGY